MQEISKTSHILLAIITTAGLLAYSNSTNNPFVFDDLHTISYSQDIQNKDIVSLWQQQTTRFIPLASFAIQSGANVSSYHIVNIVLHITTASIVYIFASLLLQYTHKKEPSYIFLGVAIKSYELQAFFVSLLFTLHPIQTQAVTYIVQRTTILAAFLYIGSLTLYIYGRIHKNPWFIVGAFICSVIAMFTKEIAITLPLTIAVLEYTIFRTMWTKINWRISVLRIALFLLTIGIIPLTLWVTRGYVSTLPATIAKHEVATHSQEVPQEEQLVLPQKEYFLTQLNVVRIYIQLLILPLHLNIDHDIPTEHTLFHYRPLLSAIFLGSLLYIAWIVRKRLPVVSFGILFFFLALSLESSFFPIEDVMFEHRIYLPSVGFFLAVITSLFALPISRMHTQRIAFMLILLATVCAYGTYMRNITWSDPIRLWSDAVAKSPHKIRPKYNLAWSYMEIGDQETATNLAEDILTRNPKHALSKNILGLAAYKKNDYVLAEEYFKEAVLLAPKLLSLRGNLASVLGREGKIDESIQVSLDALVLDPHYIDARINLAASYTRLGKYNEAIEQYLAVIAENPNIALPYKTLGAIYAQQGKIEESQEMYKKAAEIDQDK